MDDLKKKKARGDKKIKDPLIKLHKKKKKKTRKKLKEKENFKNSIKTSFFSHIFKSGKEKNPGRLRLKVKQKMEGMFFKGLRSDYITRKTLDELNEARKNEDLNSIMNIGKVLLQRGEHQERSLKRLHDDRTDEREPEKSAKISDESLENLKHCSLSPISGFISPFVGTTLVKHQKNKLNFEKEFKIFLRKYEETVGNEVLLRLPVNGVLEDALNAIAKVQETRQTDHESSKEKEKKGTFLTFISEDFKENETQLSKEFNFPTKDFEPENPAAEDFIKKFIFSDNLSPSKSDYYYESFMGNSLGGELLMLNQELQNYHRVSFHPVIDNNYECIDFQDFASHSKNFKSSTKDLTITTPQIQFYRRNMF